ncbi:hypothetical protein WMF18_37495 [Sorangium sp. So ce315]|uniref:hypothetical protein n=1 Tax=Sorangium sp. So ce315 TaxID=3133299 RepID=UPI003F5F5B37
METLAARVARAGPLPARDAVGWVVRLAKRVERLHARGTVHGRLSAACVVTEGEPCASRGWLSDPLATPAFVGYRSPERAAGEGPSRRDDTWALAVTLYVALSGRLPFPAESDGELRRLQRAGAAPRETPPGAEGDALWRVLEQALARDARQRIVEVDALRRALEAARPGDGLEELPPLDEHPLAEPPKAVPAPRPSSGGLRGASSSHPPRRSAPPRESSGGSQPPRKSAPPRDSSGGSQPPRKSASPHGGTSSLPPPSGSSTARRTPVPLQGLATLGLRSTAGTPTTPVPEAPDRPATVPPAPPAATPELASAARAGAASRLPGPASSPAHAEEPTLSLPQPLLSLPQPPLSPPQPPLSPPQPPLSPPQPPLSPPQPSPSPPQPFFATGDEQESPSPVRAVPLFEGDEMPPTPSPFALAPGSDVARVRAPAPRAPRAPAAAPAQRPLRERPSAAGRIATLVLCAVAFAGAAAAAWLWLRHLEPATSRPPDPTQPAAPAACAAPAEPGAPPAASAAAQEAAPAATQDAAAGAPELADADAGAASAAPTDAASAAPTDAAPAELAACVAPFFPGKSVDAATAGQMSFICAEVDPTKGVAALKSHLAQAAGPEGISEATKEWGALRWFDMAALATLRARCCDAPPPLDLPHTPEGCPPLDAALNDLAAAVASASTPDDRALAKATRQYTRAVQCVVRIGAASHYGRKSNPTRGEARAFKTVLSRALQDATGKR